MENHRNLFLISTKWTEILISKLNQNSKFTCSFCHLKQGRLYCVLNDNLTIVSTIRVKIACSGVGIFFFSSHPLCITFCFNRLRFHCPSWSSIYFLWIQRSFMLLFGNPWVLVFYILIHWFHRLSQSLTSCSYFVFCGVIDPYQCKFLLRKLFTS